jgi:ATP-binding cassette subfamily G (WHITE) protein 2
LQDDILLGTMTPLESFWFTANLKLRIPQSEKRRRINSLIKDLGLENCANTRIGNAVIRGISGGERKRTSIGVELLIDPSLIFLDEPTTGTPHD